MSYRLINHYKILEINESASQAEIRQAYKKLAKLYHPDRNSSHHATAIFQQLAESYQILADPTLRAQYDTLKNTSYTIAKSPPRPKPPFHQRPPAPRFSQEELIRPYLPYAYRINKIFLAFAFLIFVDFVAPHVTVEEYVPETFWIPPAVTGKERVKVTTVQNSTFELKSADSAYSISEGWLTIEKSPIFRVPRLIILKKGRQLRPYTVIYEALVFFPVLLLLFSLAGNLLRGGAVVDFNLTIVSGILFTITLAILIISI